MHETGLIRDLLQRMQAEAAQAGADRISSVEVWIGGLSQMSPEHFLEHFAAEARGTLAEGARVNIVRSDDPADPAAMSVVLRSIDLEQSQPDTASLGH